MGALQIATAEARPMRSHSCLECGEGFDLDARFNAEFCGDSCRKAFNNRRATRGAVIYDLFMALRYERKLASKLKVWKLLCRLAMDFRKEDHEQRDSRKSWQDARKVLRERPYLHGVLITNNAAGVRRRPN